MCVGKCMPWHTCGGQTLVDVQAPGLSRASLPSSLSKLMPHWKHSSGLGAQHVAATPASKEQRFQESPQIY